MNQNDELMHTILLNNWLYISEMWRWGLLDKFHFWHNPFTFSWNWLYQVHCTRSFCILSYFALTTPLSKYIDKVKYPVLLHQLCRTKYLIILHNGDFKDTLIWGDILPKTLQWNRGNCWNSLSKKPGTWWIDILSADDSGVQTRAGSSRQ